MRGSPSFRRGIGLAVAGLLTAGLDGESTARTGGHPQAPRRADAEVSAIGCRSRPPLLRERGPSRGRKVALTFDGGPSAHTTRVLDHLRRAGVHATFFIRGEYVPGRTALLRRIHREGHELANHSHTHPHLPSFRELVRTSRLIQATTGFRPCVFRAPYGALNRRLIANAWRLGMVTVQWDVDTLDSLGGGSATVYSRATRRSRAGSIILMHDGPGARPALVAQVPRILAALRRRGLRQVTVSELLGFPSVAR